MLEQGKELQQEAQKIHYKEADSKVAQVYLSELVLVLQGAWNIFLTHCMPTNPCINTHPYKQW